jgi:hypothetical protein
MRQFDKKDLWPLLKDVGAWHEAYGEPGANKLFAATVRHLRRLDGDRRNRADDQTSTWRVENQTIAKLIGAMDNGGKIVARSTGAYSTAGLDPGKIVVVRDDYEPAKSKFGGEFRAYVFDGRYTKAGAVIKVNLSIAADVKGALDELHGQGVPEAVLTQGYRTYAEQAALRNRYLADPKNEPLAAAPEVGNHRTGDAIDINLVWGRSSKGSAAKDFALLKGAMNKYGLRNALPAEPWHWSRNGR